MKTLLVFVLLISTLAFGQGKKIQRAALDDLQPVRMQIKITDHFWREEAHRVGGDRIAKAGREFFSHRRAADDSALLVHAYA